MQRKYLWLWVVHNCRPEIKVKCIAIMQKSQPERKLEGTELYIRKASLPPREGALPRPAKKKQRNVLMHRAKYDFFGRKCLFYLHIKANRRQNKKQSNKTNHITNDMHLFCKRITKRKLNIPTEHSKIKPSPSNSFPFSSPQALELENFQ